MRVVYILLLCSFHLFCIAQCPDITETNTIPNCIPSCELCSGGKITISLKGGDLPHNGKIDYFADINAGFNPYNGQGVKIGSANILTPNPKCRVCPVLLGFMIDACGTEAKNEFMIIWTGSGLNTSDFNFDFAPQNNTGGGSNADIGPGGCGIASGNPGLVGGCSPIAVGANFDLPANAIWVVFTSATAFTNYDFTSVCGLTCKIYVSASTCDRTIGAFSNFDATPGNRTQVMTITGCACSTNASFDIPGSLTGNGDFWAEGSIVNNGCATPSFNQPNYTPATSTVDPFMYTIPASWCDKTYEIVGIVNPKPDVLCCMEEFTERITVVVKCPKANPASIENCETMNGQSIFILEDANTDVLGGSNGTVEYYKDMAGTMRINSPYTSGNTTIYAKIVDGTCNSNLVAVNLKVLLLPIAKAASDEACDDGSGFASFDLNNLERIIQNGNTASTVQFYLDVNKNIPISSPFLTTSTTIYATLFDGKCESKPVAIILTVLKTPTADTAVANACPEADGKATFTLLDLIPKIINGQTGVTVVFYEDDITTKKIIPPYHSGTDTIYVVVSNAKCSSEVLPIYLNVNALTGIPNLTDKTCANSNGLAIFDLINISNLLKKGDTTISIKWYDDTLQTNQLIPPVTISGKDTIYAFLNKDSCKSKAIPILLEAVKRPRANSASMTLCVDTSGKTNFDLRILIDSINAGSGLPVIFAQDSFFTNIVSSPYFSNQDTLYAITSDGNCNSLPVIVYLNTIKSPLYSKPNDTIVCNYFVLEPFNGFQLTAQASYFSSYGNQGPALYAGDTIYKNTFIYFYDQQGNCVEQDSFKVDIINGPYAGLDQMISVCEGSQVDLLNYLIQGQAGGNFIDLANSGSLNGTIFNTSGHNGKTFNFQYILNGNSFCAGDTAIIQVSIVQKLSAGLDTTLTICEDEVIDLSTLLRNYNAGGIFSDLKNTGALSTRFWDAQISSTGQYIINYETGDGVTCPKDLAQITLDVLPKITIDTILGHSLQGCDYVILPPITGKNTATRTSYFSGPFGTKTQYNPGDTIRQSMWMFVYGNDTAFCSDHTYFIIAINLIPTASKNTFVLCPGDSLKIQNTIYNNLNPSGTERFPNAATNGCDSLADIEVRFYPDARSIINQQLCETEAITINNRIYDQNNPKGQEIIIGGSMNGCDSIIDIDLKFIPTSNFNYFGSLCESQSVIVNGKTYNALNLTGTDTLKNASIFGCDSIVQILLQLNKTSTFIYRNTICKNDSIVLAGTVFNKNRQAILDTLPSQSYNGCDSIRDIQIQFFQDAVGSYQTTLCSNQSVTINGTVYSKNKSSGQEIIKNGSVNGCDSMVNVLLFFKSVVSSIYTSSICENESIQINGKTYNQANASGIDTLYGQALGGCDSIVRVNIIFKHGSSGFYQATICENDTIYLNGKPYYKNISSAIDTLKGFATNGCDSILTIQLLLNPNKQGFIKDTLCPDESILINGKTYNANNKKGIEYLSTSSGCDSIINIDLQFSNLELIYESELIIPPGSSYTISINPNFSPAKIVWSPVLGLSCSDCLNPIINPSANTIYVVEITDENGCIVLAQISVKIEIDDNSWVPNVFSPNGDNINDIFKVISSNPAIQIQDFAIFDRWGNQVYYEHNKTIADHRGWDGNTLSQEKLNPGVFVYYIRLLIPGGHEKILYGDINLIK
ncbi:MAG: gliding motility-associated C-terminal domain-containing protein [Saprospiraceae bacterium]